MQILEETEEYIVINKPFGIAVHPDGKVVQETVTDWVLKKYPELVSVGEPLVISKGLEDIIIPRPGIVHRLDKDTTGCLLIAKTQDSYEFFKAQFQNHEIKKTYEAVAHGVIKEDHFFIKVPIGRSKGDIRKWAVPPFARGELREAETEVIVLGRLGITSDEKKGSTEKNTYTYVLCKPKTGRTHQIRVHLKSVNHAIVCDHLYASHRDDTLCFSRLALHAKMLEFIDQTGKQVTVMAPYPEDFEEARKLFSIK